MNRALKLMLLIAVVWGSLAILVIMVFNYMFEVNIHWKEGRKLDQLAIFKSLTKSTNTHSLKSSIFEAQEKRNAEKFQTLPVHDMQVSSCSHPLCTELLTPKDRLFFNNCTQKTVSMEAKFGPILNASCRFQNGSGLHPVALASFPGSGNTWVRGLLERVTGVCTGALYCDGGLRTKGFAGEGVRGPSVLVVKTHGKSALFSNRKLPRRILNDAPVYGGAILLVRDPRRAMIAEWHREKTKRRNNSTISNHYLYVGKEYFGNNMQWAKYVKEKLERWKAHISGWCVGAKFNPFLIIHYEDLKSNAVKGILKMTEFLGFKNFITEDIIRAKIGGGYSNFYRNHEDNFEHFTTDQSELISKTVQNTMDLLDENGVENSFLRKYL